MVNSREATAEAVSIYTAKFGQNGRSQSEAALSRTFQEISRVYGPDNALDMVKIWPNALNCDSKNFKPVFDIYAEKFGEEETIAMLKRNPNLLGCRAEGPNSVEAGDDVMVMSYIIAFTRPAGSFLLALLLSLVSLPVLEGLTGIPIRANLFHL